MQLDRSDGPDSRPGPQSKGHKGATLAYRKIQNLELDPLFLAYLQKPLFRHVCERAYGDETAVACYRAMFMNKPSGLGSHLIWHQDRWTALDRDPLVTVWTALDPATPENGCVQNRAGVARAAAQPRARLRVPHPGDGGRDRCPLGYRAPGDGGRRWRRVLLHNHLLHSSGVNRTRQSRRAFSVCYMEAATVCSSGAAFPVVFGEGALAA